MILNGIKLNLDGLGNHLDHTHFTRSDSLAVAYCSAPLCGVPFTWRTPRGTSSVPLGTNHLELTGLINLL